MKSPRLKDGEKLKARRAAYAARKKSELNMQQELRAERAKIGTGLKNSTGLPFNWVS